jgi:hypothetical protein
MAWTIIANALATRALDRLIADVPVGAEMIESTTGALSFAQADEPGGEPRRELSWPCHSLPSNRFRRSIRRRARRSFN